MDRAAAFLEALRPRLAPGCDAEVVEAVFRRASAGHGAARGRDGRRVSVLTPAGIPFEASVTGDEKGPAPALRYNTETATSMPFFGPRLAAAGVPTRHGHEMVRDQSSPPITRLGSIHSAVRTRQGSRLLITSRGVMVPASRGCGSGRSPATPAWCRSWVIREDSSPRISWAAETNASSLASLADAVLAMGG
jgi:hypothetical protein